MHQNQLYFNQDCPCCGRGMRVRVELLGREIICSHCTTISVAGEEQDSWRLGLMRRSSIAINSIANREKTFIQRQSIQPIA